MAAHAKALADGIVDALPGWVERAVDRVHRHALGPPPSHVVEAATRAGVAAAAEIGPSIRELLDRDIDEQTSTPLAVIRDAVRFPTAVLLDVGVPPVPRDRADAAMFPADVYGLTPANFADVDPSLVDPGIAWGAAKAWLHRERHA
ncbi:MAG: hypothetical protein ACYDH6_08085 [Acidimicrobiales bacterium]